MAIAVEHCGLHNRLSSGFYQEQIPLEDGKFERMKDQNTCMKFNIQQQKDFTKCLTPGWP